MEDWNERNDEISNDEICWVRVISMPAKWKNFSNGG